VNCALSNVMKPIEQPLEQPREQAIEQALEQALEQASTGSEPVQGLFVSRHARDSGVPLLVRAVGCCGVSEARFGARKLRAHK